MHKQTKSYIITAFMALLCLVQAQAIEIYSRKLNTTGGLPDDNVRSLAVDQKGFLWMGTPDGLYRFDGYFFTRYSAGGPGSQRLIDNDHISGCYTLPEGRMLFRSQGDRIAVFNVARNCFEELPEEEKQHLYEWARLRRTNSETLAPYKALLSAGGNYINDNLGNTVVLDQTGQIWFIDRTTGETIRMKVFDEHLFPLVSSHKYKVMTSRDGGLIWVSTNGCGITLYDRRTHEEQHIRASSGLISTDYIQDICLDAKENLWVADEFHGLVYLATGQNNTETHLLLPDSRELRCNQVAVMHWKDANTLLLANTKGDVFEADGQLNLRQTMTGIDLHSFCTDQQGRLWIGSRRQGFRSPDGVWHPHRDDDVLSPSGNNVAAILCDRSNRIWIGCEEGGLDLVVPQADGSMRMRHLLPKGIQPLTLYEAHDGTLWVGAHKGLYSFQPSKLLADPANYRQHLKAEDTRQSHVSCIYEDRNHHLWVGTNGDGVYHSADGGKTFQHLTMNDGLISNDIQSFIAAEGSTLWIATKKGITCYDTPTGSCHHIYNDYNPQQNYYNANCACLLPDGRLAFGTNQGVVVVDDRGERREERGERRGERGERNVVITDLLINGESVGMMEHSPLDVSPDDAGEIRLAHDQNTLTVRFSAFNYNSTTGTRYTYWLEGYDRSWNETSAYSFANYKNLPPGHYTLHVRAYDNQQQGVLQRTLSITILSPWWLTWWACLIYLLLAAVVGWGIYRQLSTVYRLRRRISIEQQLTELKLQFFTNISHEFRTPLTIIRGSMDRIRAAGNIPAELRQPVSSMQKSTDRMLRLVNQLLEFRKMQNGKLRLALEETDVVAFVKDICQNFTDMAQNKKIGFAFTPSVKSLMVFIDRQHVDKMVFNLLSNAFKYTPAKGTVTVSLRADDEQLQIVVADTGVGIPRDKQPELFQRFMQSTFQNDSIGIGLHLTKALADVHHGSISFRENQPQGSVFTLTLPVKRDVYAPDDFIKASELAPVVVNTTASADYRELAGEPMNDCRVLVVEDDADVAEFLRQTLCRFFDVDVAMDGSEALNKATATIPGATAPVPSPPDLIITDVMMPVMDGYELLRQLRKNPATQHIPVVMLTALSADDQRLKATTQGVDAYLTKPFDAKLLVATCRQLIEQRGRLRQSFSQAPAAPQSALPQIIVEERDKQLLDLMDRWLSDHLGDPAFSVDELASVMGYGRSQFYKKVKNLTGQTPADYVRTLRMNRAADLLRSETITVAEVCYQVGFSDPHYFGKMFKQQFGITPKKYQQGQSKNVEPENEIN